MHLIKKGSSTTFLFNFIMYFGCHVQRIPWSWSFWLRSAALYLPYLLTFRWGSALVATDAAISRGEIKGRLSLSQLNQKSTAIHKELVTNRFQTCMNQEWITTLGDVDNLKQHAVRCSASYTGMQYLNISKMWTNYKHLNENNVIIIKRKKKNACKTKLEDRTYVIVKCRECRESLLTHTTFQTFRWIDG